MGGTGQKPSFETSAAATVEQLAALVAEKDQRIATLERQVAALLEKLGQMRELQFGSPAAKDAGGSWVNALLGLQGVLPFKELAALEEKVANGKVVDLGKPKPAEKANEPGTRKRRGPRRHFPEHLPRKITKIELPEGERTAPCGGELQPIGVEITRELERISCTYVHEIHQVKYACKEHPEEGVRTAPGRKPVIEGGLLGVGMLADVIVERMGNHMPYHRLQQKYASEGLDLSRSVLCNSAHRCAEILVPIYRAQLQQILGDELVQLDDTSVVVRNGRQQGRQIGRMWAYRGQRYGLVCYQFTTDKCAERPLAVLSSFHGYVQGDAYSGHNALFVEGSRIEVGCWGHALRKFRDAKDSEPTLAAEALEFIGQIYRIERQAKTEQLNAQARTELRRLESKPVLDKLSDWLEVTLTKVLPAGGLAKAIRYTRNQWHALTRFAEDGRIEEIDNNLCEQALRRVAVGRKNWMFIGFEERGPSNAVLMSLVNSCKALAINPHEYLRDVLQRISIERDVQRLTPLGWRQDSDARRRVETSRQAIASVVRGLVLNQG